MAILRLPTLAALAVLFAASPVLAQREGPQLRTELTGTVLRVTAGLIEMKAETGRVWTPRDYQGEQPQVPPGLYLIAVQPRRAEVMVTGTAGPEYLSAGQAVRLSGRADAKGNFEKPVARLEVFPPGRDFEPSLEVVPEPVKFSEETKESPYKSIEMAGLIRAARGGNINVQVGRNYVTVPIDPEAKVAFTDGRYVIAQRDDTITVSGQLHSPGKLIAQSGTIRLKDPIGGAAEKEEKKKGSE